MVEMWRLEEQATKARHLDVSALSVIALMNQRKNMEATPGIEPG